METGTGRSLWQRHWMVTGQAAAHMHVYTSAYGQEAGIANIGHS